MKKKILFFFTIFFFAGMLFLTLFSEQIHNTMLPKVTVSRPKQMAFPYEYTDENGETQTASTQKNAVPKTILEGGVYVLYSAEKNGTKRNFVKPADLQTGEEREGYVEIVSGIMFSDRVVIDSSEKLWDGCEVTVE